MRQISFKVIQYKENQKYRWDSGLRKLDLPLKALRQLSQNVWPKILTPYFFTVTSTNCENIFKIVCIVSEKIGKQISQFYILFPASTRSCLFTTSLKSKVLFQCHSEITWPTSPWLANSSSLSAAVCLLLKIFYQDNKFFYVQSNSSFLTSVTFQNLF